ncbi:hypothetical protein ACFPTO_09270 [Paraburkholderia denitrificans]|uniref:Uncharacterized protein n=1 Tax=Paraburkholderia denitrificans TaxID=694025 RepID=A0ABW0J7E2_9BURK
MHQLAGPLHGCADAVAIALQNPDAKSVDSTDRNLNENNFVEITLHFIGLTYRLNRFALR